MPEAHIISNLEQRQAVAQILLLQKCRTCISRLLKREASTLLPAKVLAFSRLLHKTLSQPQPSFPVLETLRDQLSSLRRRILRKIENRLSSIDTPLEALVEAISAFCLVTSSSSNDALRHYHHLRLQELRRGPENQPSGHTPAVQLLKYYLGTLQTTKLLLGRSLNESLRVLRSQPILSDPSILQLEDLDLGVLSRWVVEEVREFVPFIKHNVFTKMEIDSATSAWSKEAFNTLIELLREQCENLHSISELLDARKALLEIWLPECVSVQTHSASEVFDGLRQVLNSRISRVLQTQAKSLARTGSIIAKLGEGLPRPSPIHSVWEADFVTMPLGKGASKFRQSLKIRHLNLTPPLSSVLLSLETWISNIHSSQNLFQDLRRDRWLDLVEEDDEDDEFTTRLDKTLRMDDPDAFQSSQNFAVQDSILLFQRELSDLARKATEQEHPAYTMLFLRAIREVCTRLKPAFPDAKISELEAVAPALHARLAEDVSMAVFPASRSNLKWKGSTAVLGIQLWEGDPPMPTQPSPRAFKLLRNVSIAMAERGGDLWGKDAVDAVKASIRSKLVSEVYFPLMETEKAIPNGIDAENSENTPSTPVEINAVGVQTLFDALYFSSALETSSTSATEEASKTDEMKELVDGLSRSSGLGADPLAIMKRRAEAYWARTSLLFGLLA